MAHFPTFAIHSKFKLPARRCPHFSRRGPHLWITRRHQVVLAELWDGKFARRVRMEVARAARAGQRLLVDLSLQGHEGMDERLGPRRTAGDVDIHRNITINALEHVVTLLER